jgi:hypothetical protein
MKPEKKSRQYKYPENNDRLLNRGQNDIISIYRAIDRYRLDKYPQLNKTKFVNQVINKDVIRVKPLTYLHMVKGRQRRETDFKYLPNFFFVPNVLEPLNLTLQELFELYGKD